MTVGEHGELDVPGLDLVRLRAFLQDAAPGLVGGDLSASIIAGGKSNLTYAVTDGTWRWIVRRPPLGHVLATAHDMAREYRVMSALQGTGVPVPRMIVLCEDPSVVGAPCYLMEHVDGRAYRRAEELREIGPERTGQIARNMVDTLLMLHEVDPGSIGLADFGRPERFLERQVRRWKQQLEASQTRALPRADLLHARLADSIPAETAAAIVHGDYRLDNLLVGDGDQEDADQDDAIAAVVDWEMATIGDPLTDVALLYVYMRLARIGVGNAIADAMCAPGFLTADQALARYAERSPRDTTAMPFYLGLAFFKLAVIVEGIHRRFVEGKTVGDGFSGVGALVDPLIEEGIAAMEGRP
ncbi:MAG: phosphotransferase family protein [Actinomycetales bacterium]|nr:phosphotransferase family protein [Actinomycetales bacterium]